MEEKPLVDTFGLEKKIEGTNGKNMTFGSVFKSMIPAIIVGTVSAAGCQEIAAECTSNPEMITLSGMAAQYVGGWGAYIPIHYFNNHERLTDERGKVRWGQYGQDIGAVLASDQVGGKVWALSYVVANETCLRSRGIDPCTAGVLSGLTSGLIYSAFTAWATPKINSGIDYVKKILKGGTKNATKRI